jgi:cytochrome c oxidase subunit I
VSQSTIGTGPGGPAGASGGAAPPAANYLTHAHGWRSWAFTLDHKRIAIMYLVSILASFVLGGILAMLIRTELLGPARTIMSAESYNRTFTLHGAVMVFLFIIPGVPAALGNFILPIMLGAKDLAFPKMNLASFYLYVLGAIFSVLAIATGGIDTGWTFYTPYSTTTSTSVIAITIGVFILGFSSIFTGINFIVTIHKMRPPGMTWFRMPLFLWATYATSIIQVVATPVLGITALLLIAERALGIGIFDPRLGGDPILYQHFFWFYSHPAVYIMILPAMGIISEVISVFSRKPILATAPSPSAPWPSRSSASSSGDTTCSSAASPPWPTPSSAFSPSSSPSLRPSRSSIG